MRAKKPYHKRQRSKDRIDVLCGEAWPEDGIDPRYDRRGVPLRKPGRKALQLCSEVKQALEYALAGACSDPLLHDLEVQGVEPAPHSGRLLVRLCASAAVGHEQVFEHLQRAAGKLRCEVALA